MSRVGRLAGALLAETEGRHYLVGHTKEPCDFAAAGLEPPVTAPAGGAGGWHVRLNAAGPVDLAPPWLTLELEGEALAPLLAERMLIARNGSVSERLWRLVARLDPDGAAPARAIDARWLAEVPDEVWQIVREAVLRCS